MILHIYLDIEYLKFRFHDSHLCMTIFSQWTSHDDPWDYKGSEQFLFPSDIITSYHYNTALYLHAYGHSRKDEQTVILPVL